VTGADKSRTVGLGAAVLLLGGLLLLAVRRST
jgi:LPXTG-motif cell wall-anchored protein